MPSRSQLEELLQSEPDDDFLQFALAMACIAEGDRAAGLDQFQRVIDQHPDYVPAYFQMGQVLAGDGKTDEAKDVLRRGIDIAHKTGDSHAEMEMRGFLETL